MQQAYDQKEAAAIANLVMENITGMKKIDRIIHKDHILSAEDVQRLERYASELQQHKPVQYVLHEAWFCGMKFFVDESVLIPRPETEELVDWMFTEMKLANKFASTCLDVGTGSGCIAVALKKKLPSSMVLACDMSEKALEVAERNARALSADVQFQLLDFLDENQLSNLPSIDLLVSNPPYIPATEKNSIARNVVDYEPHLALFVPDTDPIIFYRAMVSFAIRYMRKGAMIFAELHETTAQDVAHMFDMNGLQNVELKRDIHGKPRMIKALV